MLTTHWIFAALWLTLMSLCARANEPDVSYQDLADLRVATFNISLYGEAAGDLAARLGDRHDPKAQHAARVIQAVRPDVLLLNEIDFEQGARSLRLFQDHYLAVAQDKGLAPIEYEYSFMAEPNTGLPSGQDFDGDGKASDRLADALGYGAYPGQYGMALLSRYPISYHKVRTFQHLLWRDLPEAQLPQHPETGAAWYDREALSVLPLSSKSHWDIPIELGERRVHLLASHPSPPAFDGPERRNALRNHEEVRFWRLYLDNHPDLVDDLQQSGGLAADRRFVILGDLNASDDEGDSLPNTIGQLLQHPSVNGELQPESRGAVDNAPENPHAALHTAVWQKRVDYVLPSRYGFKAIGSGVYWPGYGQPNREWFLQAEKSSDHRLVYVDLQLTEAP